MRSRVREVECAAEDVARACGGGHADRAERAAGQVGAVQGQAARIEVGRRGPPTGGRGDSARMPSSAPRLVIGLASTE